MVKKTCPHCQGALEGCPATLLVTLATSEDDYIWQCQGDCAIFMFNCPLADIDTMIAEMIAEREKSED